MKKNAYILVLMFCLATVTITISCNNNAKQKTEGISTSYYTQSPKQNSISTTEDWINFISATDDIEKIDEGLTSMKPCRIIQIAKELSEMVSNLNANEPHVEATCRALIYILITPTPHQIIKDKYSQEGRKYTGFCFSESECDEFDRIFDGAPREKAMSVLGNKEVNKIFGSFDDWVKTLH